MDQNLNNDTINLNNVVQPPKFSQFNLNQQVSNQIQPQVISTPISVQQESITLSNSNTTVSNIIGNSVQAEPVTISSVNTVANSANTNNNVVSSQISEQASNNIIKEPIISDEFAISTEKLNLIVRNLSRVAIHEPTRMITCNYELDFSENGLVMYATDEANVFKGVDTSVKFVNKFHTGVDSITFKSLISKITTDVVKFVPDPETRILTIVAGRNTFRIPEAYDLSTGQPFECKHRILSDDIQFEYTEPVKIDYNKFKQALSGAIPFMSGFYSSNNNLEGILFGDQICATNEEIIFARDNQNNIKTNPFYLSHDTSKLLNDVVFDGEVSMSFAKTAQGDTVGVRFISDSMVVDLATDPYHQKAFPIDSIEAVITRCRTFDKSFKINKQALKNALDIATLYNNDNSDNVAGVVLFNIDPVNKEFRIRDLQYGSDQRVPIEIVLPLSSVEFKLNLAGFQSILSTYAEDNLTFRIYDKFIAVTVDNAEDNLVEIISIADDD